MSEDLKWALGMGLPIVVALLGVVWKLLAARIDAVEKSIWDQIGRDSNSGMRKHVHDSANMVSRVTPELGEHARRLERLEMRVFNGHGVQR